MAKSLNDLAKALGARVVVKLPETGGGAFGAAKLGKIFVDLQKQLNPGRGKRPGRPTVSEWTRRPKIPMSKRTENRLIDLAKKASSPERRISPMQLAAKLLEEAFAQLPDDQIAN